MSATETIVVKGDAIPVDLLLWRRFRRYDPGLVERVLYMNPGIADGTVFLPIGFAVVVPLDAPNPVAASAAKQAVKLYD